VYYADVGMVVNINISVCWSVMLCSMVVTNVLGELV
jgi:hypothetical protein